MKIPEKDLIDAEDDVSQLFKIHKGYWNEPRYKLLQKFCSGSKKIISVGCGPKEPIIIHATHATDITPLSHSLLQNQGWAGEFTLAFPYDLPFPDKSFDLAVCSEVIEHMPDLELVKKIFHEVSRISKKWIISTPNSQIILPKNQNPNHKHFFTLEIIKSIVPFPCKIYTNHNHIYMENLDHE